MSDLTNKKKKISENFFIRYWKPLSFVLCAVALLSIFAFTGEVSGQTRRRRTIEEASETDTVWYWATLIILVAALGFGIVWWRRNRALALETDTETPRLRAKTNDNAAVVEIERETNEKVSNWMRGEKASGSPVVTNQKSSGISSLTRQNDGTSDLIILQLKRLNPSRSFEPLPVSSDETLLEAIEQIQSDEDDDEEFRELSIRVLSAFKTQNSIDALAQVAHYDLSPTLRVKAVQALADCNHESVFEPILLACADPAREVKAAAARAIARLSIDRTDAFTRIIEHNDDQNMHIAAHACIESGFAERAFERLTHNDPKQVYEAFAIITLLIKSGQNDLVLHHLEHNQNPNIRLAIVHILGLIRPSNLSQKIYEIGSQGNQVAKVQEALNKLNEDYAVT